MHPNLAGGAVRSWAQLQNAVSTVPLNRFSPASVLRAISSERRANAGNDSGHCKPAGEACGTFCS
jgi:hypothetical protein